MDWFPFSGHAMFNVPPPGIVTESHKNSTIDKKRRGFNVVFILMNSLTGFSAPPDSSLKAITERLNSHESYIGDEHVHIRMLDEDDSGKIKTFQAFCDADSIEHAVEKAFRHAVPLMNYISLLAGVSIEVHSLNVIDNEYGVMWITEKLDPVAREIPLLFTSSLAHVFEPILGLYREGKTSNSPYYRCFCFHKILEGFYQHREIFKITQIESERLGYQRKSDKKRVTKKMLGLSLFPLEEHSRLIEMTYQEIYELSNSEIRNIIAHYKDKLGNRIQYSDYNDYKKHVFWANLMEQIVISLIDDEMKIWIELLHVGEIEVKGMRVSISDERVILKI